MPRRKPLAYEPIAACLRVAHLRVVRQAPYSVPTRVVDSAGDSGSRRSPKSPKPRSPDHRGSPCPLGGPCHSIRNGRCYNTENSSCPCRCTDPRFSPMSNPRAGICSSFRDSACFRYRTCARSRFRHSRPNSRRSCSRNSPRTCVSIGLWICIRSCRRNSARSGFCDRPTNRRRTFLMSTLSALLSYRQLSAIRSPSLPSFLRLWFPVPSSPVTGHCFFVPDLRPLGFRSLPQSSFSRSYCRAIRQHERHNIAGRQPTVAPSTQLTTVNRLFINMLMQCR